jgi:hypothetical protein
MEEVTYLDSGMCRRLGGDADTLIYYCQPVDAELKCGICLGTVDDPVSCGNECISRYCHGCLSRAILSRRECPTCKREARKPVRDLPLKARLARMLVFCPKSKITQAGQIVGEDCCAWSGPLERWNSHNLHECVYSTVNCLCGQAVLRSELATHQEQCFQQLVPCSACHADVALGQVQEHLRHCPAAAAAPPQVAHDELDERIRARIQQMDRQRLCRHSNKTSYLNSVEVAIMNNDGADASLRAFLQENRHRRHRNPFNVIYLTKFRQRCDVLGMPSPTGQMLDEALRDYWDIEKSIKKRQRRAREGENGRGAPREEEDGQGAPRELL